jgi:superfamily I DNA and/or RNA helicase
VREGKVLTVYKAQGREYPFVIVSMVRNNEDANVGFLDLPYLRGQAYVALSRAKAKMIVLVSENTFAPHPVFNAFLSIRGERCLKLKW